MLRRGTRRLGLWGEDGLCIVAGIETRENRRIERAVRLKIKIACVEKICYLSDRSVIRGRIAWLATCA